MGVPSMELPILFALTFPERVLDTGVPQFDPVALGGLTFESVRSDDFPMLGIGIGAGRAAGAAPAVFNAANEVAVAHFLAGRLRFGEIATLVAGALSQLSTMSGATLEDLLVADAAARRHVNAEVATP
jgi:1-deoxy-D-xylulose-5-phosphate reductoisomerase